MKRLAMSAAALTVVGLWLMGAQAAEQIKSGPQVGEKVPGPFHPLNCTGKFAGEKHCLYCENGANPVAVVFAREASEPVQTLIKKIDAATALNKKADMGSFVVFLSNDEGLGQNLKTLAAKQGIQHTVLSIDNPSGPVKYGIAKDAEVTVVLYNNLVVQSNHSFAKGALNEKAINQVVADIRKILPKN